MTNSIQVFSDEAKQVLAYLGILIAEYPDQIERLLKIHDVDLPKSLNENALIQQVLYEVGLNDPAFRQDLAQLINHYFNPGSSDSFTGTAGIPTDPISAIAGALGSIGNVFSQAQKNKLYKQEARTQTYSNLLAYQNMKRQLAAEERAREQAHKSKKVLLQVAGLVVVAGISLWFLLKR